eukprot:6175996-Pleurochrysis_carterae.AAC.4
MTIRFDTSSHRSGSGEGAGAGRTYGSAPVRGARRAAAAMRERGFQSSESGARALRKYACEANASWETVHVSVELRRMATVQVSNRTKSKR